MRAALVLAAGLARRMAGPNKLLLPFRGKPLIRWVVDAASASSAEMVVLVTGRDGDAVAEAASHHRKMRRIHNDDPEAGLAGSLKLGLAAVPDSEAVAILLGDMPLIESALIDALFSCSRPDVYAAVPVLGDEMGNPVVLGRAAIADCAGLAGDFGARKLIEAHRRAVVFVPVQTRSIFADIDQADDLSALE